MGKSGGGATSRRKQADDAPKGKPLDRRKIAIWGIVGVVVIALFLVGQQDGAAPQPDGPFRGGVRPAVQGWTLYADAGDGSDPTVVCTESSDCSIATMWPHVQANATCSVEARYWLGAHAHPFAVRGIDLELGVQVTRGDLRFEDNATTPNASSHPYELTPAWTGGWWFRAESEFVDVTFPTPCDPWRADVTLLITGTSVWGDAYRSRQAASIDFHDEVLSGSPGG